MVEIENKKRCPPPYITTSRSKGSLEREKTHKGVLESASECGRYVRQKTQLRSTMCYFDADGNLLGALKGKTSFGDVNPPTNSLLENMESFKLNIIRPDVFL